MTNQLTDIYNFEQMTDWLGTSGQPKREQFSAIADSGFQAVINLALPTSDHAIPDEGSVVTDLGMLYVHIPVDFAAPTLDDLQAFFGVMHGLEGRKVWVHCVVNARVSAFVFQYLTRVKGVDQRAATSRVLQKWLPDMDATWRAFLALELEAQAGGASGSA